MGDMLYLDVIVTRKATVAKLKQSVEAAFGHFPTQGDSKISWYVCKKYVLLINSIQYKHKFE